MKRFLRLSLLCSSLWIASCDVVNLDPISSLTESNFYKTADDMDRAVLGVYNRYQQRLPRDWSLFDMPTDQLYMSAYRFIGGLEAVKNLDFQAQNDMFSSFWQVTYNGVFRANMVLNKLDVPTDYTTGKKEQFEGEARFMRALFYFDLVRSFGGVPKVEGPLSVDQSKAVPRASEKEIYDLIVADLKRAVEILPLQNKIAYGRASKGAALALLGKVYVYQKDWQNALTTLDQITGMGYDLLPEYADLWKESNEDNKETVFAMKYISGSNGQRLSLDFLPYFGVEGVSNSTGGEVALVAWSLHKKFAKEDSRKAATITEYWRSPGTNNAPEWKPFVSKFMAQTASASGLDIPVIRYAEVILLRSEALYRLDRKEEALTELNKVRSRAFKGISKNYVAADIADPEKFLDVLLLERELEFALENQRWFDLVRTGRFEKELAQQEWGYNPVTQTAHQVTLTPKPFLRYFPIPQNEIDQSNQGVIKQNDGY
ncbi:RagB/SusD family nutrient uptake outer membrane protein [Ravibacter arvi]|uniref:RagB/SusD family nutrient uptake outer membrane protein n=1 Tax=Ravibacter arvi TaxID=2051041 RepID=A0ABP8M7P3_9BACT